jgi:transposase
MSQRRNFGAVFKSKVAMAAIQGAKTLNEIASQYEVHPNQISQWKKQAIERLPEVMADGRGKESRNHKPVDEAALHETIGRQAVEIEYLKKKLRKLGLLDDSE